jgi:transcriptional regulator of arginine metabolism
VTAARRERQGAILRLIEERELATQSELAQALHDEGYEAVQTTVSRDIQELGLRKVRGPGGRLVYAPPGASDADRMRDLSLFLRRTALSVEANDTLVVVTTPRGLAVPLADAIDDSRHPLVLGTIAGENTIFVAPRAGITGAALRDDLRTHLLEGAA